MNMTTPTPTNHSATSNGAASSKIDDDKSSQAFSMFVSDMLSQMEEDFQRSGDSIMDRMREMGSKMDGLEQSISGLVQEAGLDEEEDENEKGSNNEDYSEQEEGNTVAASSPDRRPPSNSSPSHNTTERVQL